MGKDYRKIRAVTIKAPTGVTLRGLTSYIEKSGVQSLKSSV